MKKPLLDLEKIDFFGMLAHVANEQKQGLVLDLVQMVREGDPAAIRLLEKALVDQKPQDTKNRPIPILNGITQTKTLPGDDSAL